MQCPNPQCEYHDKNTKAALFPVIKTAQGSDGSVKRYRRCVKCDSTFYTYERTQAEEVEEDISYDANPDEAILKLRDYCFLTGAQELELRDILSDMYLAHKSIYDKITKQDRARIIEASLFLTSYRNFLIYIIATSTRRDNEKAQKRFIEEQTKNVKNYYCMRVYNEYKEKTKVIYNTQKDKEE